MNAHSVYVHTDPKTGRRYVGVTAQNPKRRWQRGLGYVKNREFQGLIKERGWDGLKHEVVKDGLDLAAALELEERLIKKYDLTNPKRGVNMRAGGWSNRPSDEVKARIAKALLGHAVSEDTKAKLRLKAPSRSVVRYNLNGEGRKVYHSLSDAARSVGGRKPNVWAVVNGFRPTYKGYAWEYGE